MPEMLEDVKVVDLTWNIAGPLSTKCLADFGATVIKVESMHRTDLLRTYPPFVGMKSGLSRSTFHATYNSNKYSMCLDLNNRKAEVIIKRLIQWADVMIEAFRPGIVARWGFDYENCKRLNPGIIMVSASLQGQTGPLAQQTGLGTMMESSAGHTHLMGWQDRPPSVGFAYTDYCGPWFVAAAILAGLDYRRRTGRGLYFDLSQLEASMPFLSSAILDYTFNNRVEMRQGNQHPMFAPHGVYRCKGEDLWCAIAVTDEEKWANLCHAMGNPDWCRSEKFGSLLVRKKNESELNRLVEQWTASHDAEELMGMLQKCGIPCGIVQNGRDLHEDPQLAHRVHFQRVEHSEMGQIIQDALSFRFSKSSTQLRAAPALGEHTTFVVCELLGVSDEDYVDLLQQGVFE